MDNLAQGVFRSGTRGVACGTEDARRSHGEELGAAAAVLEEFCAHVLGPPKIVFCALAVDAEVRLGAFLIPAVRWAGAGDGDDLGLVLVSLHIVRVAPKMGGDRWCRCVEDSGALSQVGAYL